MSRTTFNRISAVLGLAAMLSLVPGATWAGTSRHPQPSAALSQPAAAIASLLSQGWHRLVSFWAGAGSAIDPNGSTWAPTGSSGTSSTTTDPRSLN